MVTTRNLKVFLDHHIKRDSLLYKRSMPSQTQINPDYERRLSISRLVDEKERRLLRKPDFQRSTSAWTPIECVDLLDSVLNEKVVPSVIMWLSPQNLQYVLDGGHRISVLIAWILDDWGDRMPAEAYQDGFLKRRWEDAAIKVRELLDKRGINSYDEHKRAFEEYSPEDWTLTSQPSLSHEDRRMAERVSRWSAVQVGYPIQWVQGDYQVAEDSFLKINKTGRRLTDWETKLVENRTSSFARAVMAVAEIQDSRHCWPTHDPDSTDNKYLEKKVDQLQELIKKLNELIFSPAHILPIKRPNQPLVAPPAGQPEIKPSYLSELFTITEGKKGQKTETQALIKQDTKATATLIVSNGLTLLQRADDAIGHIYGGSPRSLLLMPLLYFYNPQGRYVRSLLYGMLYWMNFGSHEDILNRKLLFTIHRKAFEHTLMHSKEEIVKRITRRIGSGTEVTVPTARYFDGLLRLLITCNDEIEDSTFSEKHQQLIETLKNNKDSKPSPEDEKPIGGSSRTYRNASRDSVTVRDYLQNSSICGICDGRYVPNIFTQVDHITPYSKKGKTVVENARHTHPFCNNQREKIEKLFSKAIDITLPDFMEETKPNLSQLPLFEFLDWHHESDDLIEDEEDWDEEEITPSPESI